MNGVTLDTVFIGRCAYSKAFGCQYTVRKACRDIKGWNEHRCPDHQNYPLNWRAINGKVNAEKKCDSRCTGARGHNCECACGGANHGLDYA